MLAFSAALLALAAFGPAPASHGTPLPIAAPTAPGEALIVKSASTNTDEYHLHVFANGTVAVDQGMLPIKRRVSTRLVARFFADLRAAGNLAALPAEYCMKSASFGTTTRIAYRGTVSPDVSCPASSRVERTLDIDAEALATAAGVSIVPGPRRGL